MKRFACIFLLLILLAGASTEAAFPDGWGRRCAIVIQASKVDENLTDYAWLVTEDCLPAEMFDNGLVKPGGGDIRWSSDEDGSTQLASDPVFFDTVGTNKCEIHVGTASVSSSSNTTLYVWYDSASSNVLPEGHAYGKHNVWPSINKAVLHFNEIPTSGNGDVFYDATSNSNDFTETNGGHLAEDRVMGQIGYALDFDNAHVDRLNGGDIDITGVITLQVWLAPKAQTWGTAGLSHIISKWESYAYRASDSARTTAPSDGGWITTWDDPSVFTAENGIWHGTNVWFACSGVYDGSNLYNYENGGPIDTTAHTGDLDLNDNIVYLGYFQGGGYTFNGAMDEIRIIEGALTEGWISSEDNNLDDPATFAIEGTPETPGAPPAETNRRRRLLKLEADR